MRHRLSRLAIALCATLAVVAQTLAGAWATSRPLHVDAFGNPLCIGGSVSDALPGQGQPDERGCCALGCCPANLSAAPPSDAAFTLRFAALPAIQRPAIRATTTVGSRCGPGRPRAPPVAV